MFAAPGLAGDTKPALHFVEDEQDVVLVADAPQGPEPLRPEMIVAPFALDRLDDNRRDILAVDGDDLLDLGLSASLSCHDILLAPRLGRSEERRVGKECRS